MGSTLGVVVLGVSADVDAHRSQLEEVGKKLAMHVVAAKPAFLDKSYVPIAVQEAELAICR